MDVKVHKKDGGKTKRSVTLEPSVFDIEPSDHAIWLDVRAIQAHARQGTHKAKERGENAHSTRKLYRQKGTGHARAGSAKSPIRKSGGTTFGPRPRTYDLRVNRKTKQLARRSALTYKAREDALFIVEDFSLDTPSTREMANLLAALELSDRKVLFLTGDVNETLYRSGRNMPKVQVQEAASASTLDLVGAQVIVMQEGAVQVLNERLGKAEAAPATAE